MSGRFSLWEGTWRKLALSGIFSRDSETVVQCVSQAIMVCCVCMGCYLVLDLLLLGMHVEGKWKAMVGNKFMSFLLTVLQFIIRY